MWGVNIGTNVDLGSFQIAPGIRLPVTFALKSEKSSALLKFKNADSEGNEMVRLEQMHVETQNPVDTGHDVKSEDSSTADSASKFLPKNAKNYKAVENIKTMHGNDKNWILKKFFFQDIISESQW